MTSKQGKAMSEKELRTGLGKAYKEAKAKLGILIVAYNENGIVFISETGRKLGTEEPAHCHLNEYMVNWYIAALHEYAAKKNFRVSPEVLKPHGA